MSGHGSWSKLDDPFPMCKCNRDYHVVDNDAEKCELVTNEEQLQCYNFSKRFYNAIKAKTEEKKKVKVSKWAGIHNFGITHYGLHPSLFPIQETVPDVFHMHCGACRTLLLRTRELIDTQAIDIKKAWKKELLKQCKSWNTYHLTVWSSGCSFSGFLGNDLQSFTN